MPIDIDALNKLMDDDTPRYSFKELQQAIDAERKRAVIVKVIYWSTNEVVKVKEVVSTPTGLIVFI